jgi:hypothetical protein
MSNPEIISSFLYRPFPVENPSAFCAGNVVSDMGRWKVLSTAPCSAFSPFSGPVTGFLTNPLVLKGISGQVTGFLTNPLVLKGIEEFVEKHPDSLGVFLPNFRPRGYPPVRDVSPHDLYVLRSMRAHEMAKVQLQKADALLESMSHTKPEPKVWGALLNEVRKYLVDASINRRVSFDNPLIYTLDYAFDRISAKLENLEKGMSHEKSVHSVRDVILPMIHGRCPPMMLSSRHWHDPNLGLSVPDKKPEFHSLAGLNTTTTGAIPVALLTGWLIMGVVYPLIVVPKDLLERAMESSFSESDISKNAFRHLWGEAMLPSTHTIDAQIINLLGEARGVYIFDQTYPLYQKHLMWDFCRTLNERFVMGAVREVPNSPLAAFLVDGVTDEVVQKTSFGGFWNRMMEFFRPFNIHDDGAVYVVYSSTFSIHTQNVKDNTADKIFPIPALFGGMVSSRRGLFRRPSPEELLPFYLSYAKYLEKWGAKKVCFHVVIHRDNDFPELWPAYSALPTLVEKMSQGKASMIYKPFYGALKCPQRHVNAQWQYCEGADDAACTLCTSLCTDATPVTRVQRSMLVSKPDFEKACLGDT